MVVFQRRKPVEVARPAPSTARHHGNLDAALRHRWTAWAPRSVCGFERHQARAAGTAVHDRPRPADMAVAVEPVGVGDD